MADYVCIAQEGQSSERNRVVLDEGLKRIAVQLLGQDAADAEISWIGVREGFGFTAGRPSTSTLVIRSVPVGFPDDRRTELMTAICDLWQEVTGCTTNEIVVTVIDGPLPL